MSACRKEPPPRTSSLPPLYKTTLGESFYSHRHSSPRCRFGGEDRDKRLLVFSSKDAAAHDFLLLALNPGPGAYTPSLSTCARPVAGSDLGGANMRWAASDTGRAQPPGTDHPHRAPPGPAQYQPSLSQVKIRQPHTHFSSYSFREARQQSYVSHGHEREWLGKHSPGPMTATQDMASSMGKQRASTRSTNPRCTFGRACRWGVDRGFKTTLGPGDYEA